MLIIILVCVLLYLMAVVIVACRIAAWLAWDMHRRNVESSHRYGLYSCPQEPTYEHWTAAMMIGLVCGVLLPVTLPVLMFRGKLFPAPKDVRMERLKRRNAELEREMGIR